jgi:hypothetical protein
MNWFSKLLLIIGIFWRGWTLVDRIKKTSLPVSEYLDQMVAGKKQRNGLSWNEIHDIIHKSVCRFWFHKAQACLAQSLVEYYYLKLFGYDPYFILELNLQSQSYYNCHAIVTDSETANRMHNNSGSSLHQLGTSRTFLREK